MLALSGQLRGVARNEASGAGCRRLRFRGRHCTASPPAQLAFVAAMRRFPGRVMVGKKSSSGSWWGCTKETIPHKEEADTELKAPRISNPVVSRHSSSRMGTCFPADRPVVAHPGTHSHILFQVDWRTWNDTELAFKLPHHVSLGRVCSSRRQ